MRILPAKSVRKSKPAYSNHPARRPGTPSPQAMQLGALACSQGAIDNGSRMTIQKMQIDALQQKAAQKQGDAASLPESLRAGIEHLSGLSMEDVKVHYNSPSPAQWQARAYAQGRDIYLAPGQERHLPHEAWHVVQQAQGRVPAMARSRKAAINYDTGLERQADVMGARATRGTHGGLAATPARVNKAIPSVMPANTMQFNGWTVTEFHKKLLEQCPDGVCDALTAVWLGGLIRPSTTRLNNKTNIIGLTRSSNMNDTIDNIFMTEKTIGVDDENFGKIMLLKQLFLDTQYKSELLTFAFKQFLADKEKQQKGSAKKWFDELSNETFETKKGDIKDYLDGEYGTNLKSSITEFFYTAEPIKYSSITKLNLSAWIFQQLENFLPYSQDQGLPFSGLVVIKAYGGDEKDNFYMQPSANHQFAFRYRSFIRQFEILDQNAGLIRLKYNNNPQEIALALGEYVHKNYIKNPMKYSSKNEEILMTKDSMKEIIKGISEFDLDSLNEMEKNLDKPQSHSPQKGETEKETIGAQISIWLRWG